MKGKTVLQDEQKLKDFLLSGDCLNNEAIIRTYEDNLYSLCRRLMQNRPDADDLYQQTWLKAFQKAQSMKTGSIRNWLYTICLNLYRDQYRKAKRREKVTSDTFDEEAKDYVMANASDGISAEHVAIENYTKSLLIEKVEKLPEKHKMPIMLYYFEDLDYSECAKVLKIPIGTVKSRLNSAKKMLQKEMEKTLSV